MARIATGQLLQTGVGVGGLRVGAEEVESRVDLFEPFRHTGFPDYWLGGRAETLCLSYYQMSVIDNKEIHHSRNKKAPDQFGSFWKPWK